LADLTVVAITLVIVLAVVLAVALAVVLHFRDDILPDFRLWNVISQLQLRITSKWVFWGGIGGQFGLLQQKQCFQVRKKRFGLISANFEKSA
jgi:hypothetical protein